MDVDKSSLFVWIASKPGKIPHNQPAACILSKLKEACKFRERQTILFKTAFVSGLAGAVSLYAKLKLDSISSTSVIIRC